VVPVVAEDGSVAASSQAISGNQPRAEVRWERGGLLSVQGQTVTLRFTLTRASLYSFWLED